MEEKKKKWSVEIDLVYDCNSKNYFEKLEVMTREQFKYEHFYSTDKKRHAVSVAG